jgi:sulfur dioxygenase
MIFQQFFDPVSSTFTYLLARRVGGEALIIDPVFEQVDSYLAALKRLRLKLCHALDTHVHADHITALGALRDLTRCITVMGEKSGADMLSMRLRDGEVLGADGLELRALYTPGHTDDSYCFVMPDRVFTGDTLLIGGSGRTDFQNGDPYAAWDSLCSRVLALPDDTLVYPAHDYNGNAVSTIGHERAHNPRLQAKSAEEYARIMTGLKLPNPKMMDIAVPANRAIGRSVGKFLKPGEDFAAGDCLRDFQAGELTLVDLREDAERRRDGVIPDSIHLPYGRLEEGLQPGGELQRLAESRPGRIVLYCAFGERSAMAVDSARQAGISGLRHLAGGLAAWLRAGGAIAPPG